MTETGGPPLPPPPSGQAPPSRPPDKAVPAAGPPPPPSQPAPPPQYAPAQAPAAAPAPPPVPSPAPAERLIGKYLVKAQLGRGGMGTVYLAEHPALGREVAIKELIVNASADPSALLRFLQEAQVMARSTHPNLVQVHDMEQVGDARYIILEYVRGRSLRDLLAAGRIPLPQVFAVMHGVLQGLNYAHRHAIVHRDMKPENVLLSDEGDVKVADFGIARLTDDAGGSSTATKTGTTVGTPQYMSPEQVSTSKVDGRSDLYSAGIMLYELVCGRPPFVATEADGPFTLMAKHVQAPPPPPAIHRPDIDPHLEEVILKALAKRPEDRYQTGAEFDDALRKVADRLCPGWEHALEPGADTPKTVPIAASSMGASPTPPAAAAVAAPVAPPTGAVPPPVPGQPVVHSQRVAVAPAHHPATPVKEAPARRRLLGCLSLLTLATAALAGTGLLLTQLHP
jgi:eukaryotic-like serine/threonine-protein kinase